MKKGILFTTMFFLFFLGLSPVYSEERKQEPKEQAFHELGLSTTVSSDRRQESKTQDSWEAYNPKGEYVGIVKKDKKRFVFYDKDEIELRVKGKNEWEMYNQKDEFVGTLIKKSENLMIYDKQKKYRGVIIGSKNLMPRAHRTKTTQLPPETAKLYLYVLKALEQIQ